MFERDTMQKASIHVSMMFALPGENLALCCFRGADAIRYATRQSAGH